MCVSTSNPPNIASGSALTAPRELSLNHHLWNNHGTWFLAYTIHPTPHTKERIRHSLKTRDLELARRRRDVILARLGAEGVLTQPRSGPLRDFMIKTFGASEPADRKSHSSIEAFRAATGTTVIE